MKLCLRDLHLEGEMIETEENSLESRVRKDSLNMRLKTKL